MLAPATGHSDATIHFPSNRLAALAGGLSLIVAAVGFMAVFSYLAARFNYPDVLDGTAADVLPKLLALGNEGRAVWAIYAFLPLLLIPAGIGAQAAFGKNAPNATRAGLVFATLAALAMMLGLARWPSMHWEMARAYAVATPDARIAMDAMFAGLNDYLGNYIGEFLGEIALNAFFVAVGVAMLGAPTTRRVFAYLGAGVGIIGWIAAFRNVTTSVALVAEINNYILPLWLIALGVLFILQSRTREPVA